MHIKQTLENNFIPALPYFEDRRVSITDKYIETMLEVNLSQKGSNKRELEGEVYEHFLLFVTAAQRTYFVNIV